MPINTLNFKLMKKIIFLTLFLAGCAQYSILHHTDRGNQVKYKYSFEMLKCDYCHKDTYIYKIVNGKKLMCNVCYGKAQDKILSLNNG